MAYFGYSITRDTYLKDGYLNAGYMYVAAFAGVAIFALFLMIGVKLVGWMLLKPYKAMAGALQYKLPFGKFIEFLDKGYGVSKTVEKEVNDDKDLEEPSLGIIAFFAIIAMPFLSYADGAFMASSQTEFAAIQTSDGSKHAIITEHSSAYVTEKYDAKQHTVIHDRQKLFSTQTENSLTTVKIRRMSNR